MTTNRMRCCCFFPNIVIVVCLLIAFPVSSSLAVENPHSSVSGMDCSTCHPVTAVTPTWWYDAEANVCGQCHSSGLLGHDVETHKKGTTILAQCTACHDPHSQMQSRTWRSSSYLFSAPSDTAADGVTDTTVRKTGAGWTMNQWQGLMLIPNVKYVGTLYRILSNSADTITIDTAGDNFIDIDYARPGSTFAVVRGKYVKENVSGRSVRFFREAGTNSFADTTATVDGICQVCHANTASYRYDGVLEGPRHPSSQAGRKCSLCHTHESGFKQNCRDCHGTPPIWNTTGGPYGLAGTDGGTGSVTAGGHTKHAVTQAYACETCHAGGMPFSPFDTTIYDKKLQIGFNIGTFQSGTFDGRSLLANGYTYSAGNAGTKITSSGTLLCSSTYCHGDGSAVATGVVPLSTSPSWTTTGTTTCTSCHAFPPAGTAKPNSHGSHNYTCENCHYTTTSTGNSITGPKKHANAVYDLAPGPGRTFSYSFSYPNGTCSNVSCHTNTGSTWGASACLDCHSVRQGSRAAVKTDFNGGSHHVQGVAVTGMLCYQCHWEANEDGSINTSYHGGSGTPGAAVNLVMYGTGTRPLPGSYSVGVTAIEYSANGQRTEIEKLTTHCLSCHNEQNKTTKPFGDDKTPNYYAWDGTCSNTVYNGNRSGCLSAGGTWTPGTSVSQRYSQPGSAATTTWGKYTTVANAAKKNIRKAYSAHGNAGNNQEGWDPTSGGTGVDGALSDFTGSVNIQCYDCHNSHGSSLTGRTTSYVTAVTGSYTGGLLKTTTNSVGGYTASYAPAAGGSANSPDKNAYSPGAALCFDCHMNENTGPTLPWGYATFGSTRPVMGYWDTVSFGSGTFGSQKRYPYKLTGNMGGHFGKSSSLASPPDAGHQINGLCTPCHDPHGVSPTLGVNAQYSVPLLKGTFLTSPYKEDGAPANNTGQTMFNTIMGWASQLNYYIDQNTFGNTVMNVASGVTQTAGEFGGLCLTCHPKTSLTNGTNGGTWKSTDRIHESVKGWGANPKHSYTCSKCHVPHNSRLPRLMATNCLNTSHKGRAGNNPVALVSGTNANLNLGGCCDGGGTGSGAFPGTGSGSGVGAYGSGSYSYTVSCHENQTGSQADQGWNQKTQWTSLALTPPVLADEPNSVCLTSCGIQLNWNAAISTDGDALQYYVEVDDAPDFSSPDYTSSWVPGTGITTSALATGKTYSWRVRVRDSVHTDRVSDWSQTDTFRLMPPTPPAAPTLTDEPDSGCTSTCAVTLQWSAVEGPDGDPVQYRVFVDDASDFATPYYSGIWISGNTLSVSLPTTKLWYWKVQARDSGHITMTSESSTDMFQMLATPSLIAEPDSECASSCAADLQWNGITIPDGDGVQYYVSVDDDSGFASPNYVASWITGTTTTTTELAAGKQYYWRVQARDAVHGSLSLVSPVDAFWLLDSVPVPTYPADYSAVGWSCYWSAGYYTWAGLDGRQFQVVVTNKAGTTHDSGLLPLNQKNWTTPLALDPNYTWYWSVRAFDPGTSTYSAWSAEWQHTWYDTGCSSSCPMIYSWDGTEYSFETDVFTRGILGRTRGTTFIRPNPNDYYVLANNIREKDGRYEFKMVEERAEIDYLDHVKLYAIDVPENRNVYAEPNIQGDPAYFGPSQILHTVAKTEQHPVSAIHINTGTDVSAEISAADGNYLILNEDRELIDWHTVEVDLGDQSDAPMIKLIVNGTMAIPNTQAGIDRAKLLGGSVRLKVEVPDGAGNWVSVPLNGLAMTYFSEFARFEITDITNIFPANVYKIRLSYLYKTLIDSITFDTTRDVPMEITEAPLASADLAYGGYNAVVYLFDDIHTYVYGEKVQRASYPMPGSYTRFGDVLPLLTGIDDKFVIMGGGEEVTYSFSALAPPSAGKHRKFLLYGNGYYKAYRNKAIPATVEPLPFAAMSNFPYDPAVESYPSDAEHTQYLLDYNTRIQ